jgi:hypothetical protein
MKRRSLEDYQRERREHEAHITPGDEERKQNVLNHGRECLRRVKGDTTWEDWMGIGAALMVITEEAMAEVGVAVWDKNNRRLVREFTQRWDEYEASALETGSNQKPLSKQERWALREVMNNPKIGAWRATLDGYNRRKLNHPNKVIERWRRATQTSDKEPKPPSPSLSTALKERNQVIAELEARNAELTEELEGAKGDTLEATAPQTMAFLDLVNIALSHAFEAADRWNATGDESTDADQETWQRLTSRQRTKMDKLVAKLTDTLADLSALIEAAKSEPAASAAPAPEQEDLPKKRGKKGKKSSAYRPPLQWRQWGGAGGPDFCWTARIEGSTYDAIAVETDRGVKYELTRTDDDGKEHQFSVKPTALDEAKALAEKDADKL